MLSADAFTNLCFSVLNDNRSLWPPSWRQRAGKVGQRAVYANQGGETILVSDLWIKYQRKVADIRHPGGWVWSEVTGTLKALARSERGGGHVGRKEYAPRSVASWDAMHGWDGPQGQGADEMSYGEGDAPEVSLTDWTNWDEWDEPGEEGEGVDFNRWMRRAVGSTELRSRFGGVQWARRHPARVGYLRRPWSDTYNRGLTDAELKVRYPVGYAAMQQNPARSKEELREPNPYGPAYWPTAQDPKTTFKGHGSTLSTHALLRDRRPETIAWPRAWLNGKPYYGHRRRRYEWQMEAHRGVRLCMLRFAWRTFRSEYRAHVAVEVQRAAVAWREKVAADRVRWRGYDFPTSRRARFNSC